MKNAETSVVCCMADGRFAWFRVANKQIKCCLKTLFAMR